ncbi:ABC-2 type transport system ATP-binding protein [Georgenia soli]|uniref:ABC-2 type transport system ATP-binding protein n=1 Tax=Georgenia soli TaxID=638953 RepID=A0A2A9EKL0_9MICO|nr:ABC transporter ATP-binding protein [Georgenia soli]PFG39627.1 ABC-2 type transport system ATP-binding protein [Georgenia soli]
METAVEVRKLRVVRGGRTALDDVDLTVRAGTLTGLLGPSGAGKTTLMRAILGVQVVAGGGVTVLGRPAGSPELRRRVGYVTQAPSVYEDLTVEENLRYFARILGVPRRSGAGRAESAAHESSTDRPPRRAGAGGPRTVSVDEALDTVGLGGHRRQMVRTLSGGELSRVSLATALLGSPELLVLDEPTVGLDPVLRDSLWSTFRRIAASGTTLLVSSHVMDEAVRCDRLVLLRAARVLADTTPGELLRSTGTTSADEAFLHLVRHGPEGTR